MSGTDFIASELNVDNINTDVSGQFVHGDLQQPLDDASNNLTLYVSKSKMNQIFLFYSDDTNGGSLESNDLSDFSNTDLKYALNLQQWNPKLQTTKQERKHVINNYLIDLFGGGASQALANTDVFSNEEQLDSDISNIFQNRASQAQRNQIGVAKHGYFNHNGSLSTVTHQKIIDASSNDYGALTRQLLESAAVAAQNNPNNTIFRRQFDTTNTSNADYNLPTGWRTFQFIDGDTFSFNLSIKQLSSFFPSWALNQSALSGGSLPTSYRVKFIISADPSGQIGDFVTPNIDISQVDNINNSNDFNNIILNNVAGAQLSDINTISSSSNDANVLIETNITVANIDFNSLSESVKTTIIQEVKELYAQQLNVNPSSILITLSSGSLKINIKIYDILLSGVTLIGGSSVQVSQDTSYVDLGATALNNGVDVTSDLIIDSSGVNTSIPGNYSVYYSVTGTSLTAIRTVVVDNISPTLQLTGDASVSINQGDVYSEQGARIIDNGVDIGEATPSGTVDVNTPGSYTITYNGSDAAGNAATPITRTVVVVDNISPTLQLTGDASVSINQGDVYSEQGARIIDNGVDIGAATPSGTVDVNTPGSYTITYNGSDAAGNAATPITRTVVVVDNIVPTIQLTGDASVSINQGDVYSEQGARIIDNGVDIGEATPSGTVDVNTPGSYTITYNGVDAAGNAASSITRTVIIVPASFTQLGSDIDGEAAGDEFGHSVSLSSDGTIVAIGAHHNDDSGTNAGHVRVYQYDGSQWNKIGQDIDGEADGDYSGISVSLSSDGSILAIGAKNNDGNGADSGHVRVYQYDGSQWDKIGQDIDGEAASDQSGYSVSLSSDGTIVAIGARFNDDNGSSAGHVRVYQYDGSQW
jgi:hypothetical protein